MNMQSLLREMPVGVVQCDRTQVRVRNEPCPKLRLALFLTSRFGACRFPINKTIDDECKQMVHTTKNPPLWGGFSAEKLSVVGSLVLVD